MTSSFILYNLQKSQDSRGSPWHHSLPGSPLGGIEDSYIKLQGVCHPDFDTHIIGKPGGVKMCVRKYPNSPTCSSANRIGDPLTSMAEDKKRNSQGYNRGSVRMYDVKSDFPVQDWNPQYYADRRIPWEQDLLSKDYLRWPIKFSGTGIKTLRTPTELRDANKPYYEYAYSFTPKEDFQTGNRIGVTQSQSLPEIKYDINRLHQPYPIWKNEQNVVKNPSNVDTLDLSYHSRIV